VHHSDAGLQPSTRRSGTHRLAAAGIAGPVGTIGDSYDCAMAEALNGTFKAELVTLHGPWRTCRDLEIAVVEGSTATTTADCTQTSAIARQPNTKPTGTAKKILPFRQAAINPHCIKPGCTSRFSVQKVR